MSRALVGLVLASLASPAALSGSSDPAMGHQRAVAKALVPAMARQRGRGDRMPARVGATAPVRLRVALSRLVAAGRADRLYVAPSADHALLCLVSASATGEVATSCSPPATFTQGVGFAVLIGDNGPGTPPQKVLVAANGRVATLVLTFEASTQNVSPNPDGGVAYTPSRGGGRLVSLRALDSAGKAIGTLRVPAG